MAMISWPIPYNHDPNAFEIVGRYIAQTIVMERFVDIILLSHGTNPRRLLRTTLSDKIKALERLIERPELNLHEWSDLPGMMQKVACHRNAFAHRMMERGDLPPHYEQGLPYKALSDAELHEQEREAFIASEACRQLVERVVVAPLNPGMYFGRADPDWEEVKKRHGPPSSFA